MYSIPIDDVQKAIEKTSYHDAPILRFDMKYFGDEIILNIMGDEPGNGDYWEIHFLKCYRVSYETDAVIRHSSYVKNLAWNQRSYYGQAITVFPSEVEGFYRIALDLSFLTSEIICSEIHVNYISSKGKADIIL